MRLILYLKCKPNRLNGLVHAMALKKNKQTNVNKKEKEKVTLGSRVSKRHNIIYSYSYKHPQRQIASVMAKQQVQSAEVAQTGYSNTDAMLIFNNHSR